MCPWAERLFSQGRSSNSSLPHGGRREHGAECEGGGARKQRREQLQLRRGAGALPGLLLVQCRGAAVRHVDAGLDRRRAAPLHPQHHVRRARDLRHHRDVRGLHHPDRIRGRHRVLLPACAPSPLRHPALSHATAADSRTTVDTHSRCSPVDPRASDASKCKSFFMVRPSLSQTTPPFPARACTPSWTTGVSATPTPTPAPAPTPSHRPTDPPTHATQSPAGGASPTR